MFVGVGAEAVRVVECGIVVTKGGGVTSYREFGGELVLSFGTGGTASRVELVRREFAVREAEARLSSATAAAPLLRR